MSKTAVSVLQELMVKKEQLPHYELVSQAGPPHQAVFKYQCTADGVTVTAQARSKKEAKQEAAKLCLEQLSLVNSTGVPTKYATSTSASPSHNSTSDISSHSYVALLRELCEEYHLPTSETELISDTGPPHLRAFEVSVSVGAHKRVAKGTTKKAARQLAAMHLYTYLRENLSKITQDFSESEALVRANEKARDRYLQAKDEQPWRPNLGQVVAEYYLGLKTHTDEQQREKAQEILRTSKIAGEATVIRVVEEVLIALGLTWTWEHLPCRDAGHVITILSVPQASPPIAVSGRPGTPVTSLYDAANTSIAYFETMLA